MTEETKIAVQPVGFGAGGLQINDTDDLWRFASIVLQSQIGPKDMKTVGSVMVAITLGAELGMRPMAALQNICVINNRPSVWGDAMLGICRRSGLFDESVFREWEEQIDDRGQTAFCTSRRLPDGEPITRSFSMQDAAKAKLLEKNTPWQTYPGRMLMFRARSWCLRDNFGDILCGMRATEEDRDIVDALPVEPVNSLEDLTEKLTKPAKLAENAKEDGTDLACSTVTPETLAALERQADEALADQARLCDEYATLFAETDSVGDVKKWTEVIVGNVASGKLTEEQAGGLYELANAAKDRLSKVT